MTVLVEEAARGKSLKRWVTARFPALSQMYLAKRVIDGGCTIDGNIVKWGYKLRGGEVLELDIDLDAPTGRRPEEMSLEILHEDTGWLVLNKPAGILVHPTKNVRSGTLANGLSHYLNQQRFWFPHRLDRGTSGVLLVAKTPEAIREIERVWRSGGAKKRYVALLEGRVPGDLTLDAPIDRTDGRKPEWHVSETGKESLSYLKVLQYRGTQTLVQLEPVTGRTNQLRIHCAHAGYPVAGDTLYGLGDSDRLYLHAERLEIAGRTFTALIDWASL